MVDIVVPSLGESVTEATVAEWLKQEGESVEADETILELETDKVTLEVNAPASGVIEKIVAQTGDTVEVDAVLGSIKEGAAAAAPAKAEAPKEDKVEEPKKEEQSNKAQEAYKEREEKRNQSSSSSKDESANLSPAVRKLISDHNLDASQIKGTGKDGRILKGDVLAFTEANKGKSAPASSSSASTASAPRETGPREERVRMTRLRQRIAERLKDAQNTAAMLTTFNEVDMTGVIETRKKYKDIFEKKHGIKLGFMSFFTKAAVLALKEYPAVNAEIDGEDIVYKNFYDIGVAVSTSNGLVVPVVRDCDQKSFSEIEAGILDMGRRASEGKLGIEEMMGGTFTITNGGIFGSMLSTPIINPPQSAILGMHNIVQRPVVVDGEITIRPIMYLALSYDHRIIDGKEAVSFLYRIKQLIEDPSRLLVDV